jgi:hypothetical protein
MRALLLATVIVVLVPDSARAQPAHPAMRYSCMSEPANGWPMVEAGVPPAIEVLHPGYAIAPFTGFAVPGLSLFVIHGGERRSGSPDRYASVEAVDAAGAVLTGRELFVRAAPRRRARPRPRGDGPERPCRRARGGAERGRGHFALLGAGPHRFTLRERGERGAGDRGASRRRVVRASMSGAARERHDLDVWRHIIEATPDEAAQLRKELGDVLARPEAAGDLLDVR